LFELSFTFAYVVVVVVVSREVYDQNLVSTFHSALA